MTPLLVFLIAIFYSQVLADKGPLKPSIPKPRISNPDQIDCKDNGLLRVHATD
jgi:hypothetical protein